jgi:adenine-specific DNA-methyltransferase
MVDREADVSLRQAVSGVRQQLQDGRPLAAHYTEAHIARLMVRWAISPETRRVLEPSFGDGAFLDAVLDQIADGEVLGVDVSAEACRRYASRRTAADLRLVHADFLTLSPDASFHSVVGNPPYVRLRELPQMVRQDVEIAMLLTGVELHESASIWLPFVVHATRFLTAGGRMAFVLPFEMTYVRYAYPLWRYLGANFGHLGVIRARQWMFDGVDQETVIFLASERGGTTDHVRYELVDRLADSKLLESADVACAIPLRQIINGERPFASALVGHKAQRLLRQLNDVGALRPLRTLADVHIGYVTGDKDFFHPTEDTIRRFRLPSAHLRPTVVSTRNLQSQGLTVMPQGYLYVPDPEALTDGDASYIAYGQALGVADRYKCRVRTPWFVVPMVKAPDLVLSVFADVPLILASRGCSVSNSLLCGYLRSTASDAEIVAACWYNTASMLSAELFVHHLGGGVMILVPQEAQRLLLPTYRPSTDSDRWLAQLRGMRFRQDLNKAITLGDCFLLRQTHGLTNGDLAILTDALDQMRQWRRKRSSVK